MRRANQGTKPEWPSSQKHTHTCTKAHTQAQRVRTWIQASGYKTPPKPRWIAMWPMHVTLGSTNVTPAAGQWRRKAVWFGEPTLFPRSNRYSQWVTLECVIHLQSSTEVQYATDVFRVASVISVESGGTKMRQHTKDDGICGFLIFNLTKFTGLKIRPLRCHTWNYTWTYFWVFFRSSVSQQ